MNAKQRLYLVLAGIEEETVDAATFDWAALYQRVDDAIASLDEEEQQIIRLRFGLEDGQAWTLEEVGERFHMTRGRIRQIEAKMLRRFRYPSKSRELKDYLD